MAEKPPIGVSLLSIVIVLVGVLFLITGLGFRDELNFYSIYSSDYHIFLVYSRYMCAVLCWIAAYGLWNLQKWGLILTVCAVSIAFLVSGCNLEMTPAYMGRGYFFLKFDLNTTGSFLCLVIGIATILYLISIRKLFIKSKP
jgi:hypothetical protein